MSIRKSIIGFVLCAGLACLYVLAYFGSVQRVKNLPKIEIVNRSTNAVPDPRAAIEITTESYAAVYSRFPAEFFAPIYWCDSRFFRREFWSEQRTERPVAPRS